jgi:hypothetical protein
MLSACYIRYDLDRGFSFGRRGENVNFSKLGNLAATAAGLSLLALGLQGCGGGGGAAAGGLAFGSGGSKTLNVNFDYPNHFANVWQATTLDIRTVGLEGYGPVCSLLTGDLPKGLAFEANSCRISGTPTELGSASPTIRLTARGVTGQVDEQIQFVVQGPSADYDGP